MSEEKTKSLAQFIAENREKRGFSQSGLAKRSAIELRELEEIESGQLLFLSTVARQKLAGALKLRPAEIKEYEKSIDVLLAPDEKYIEEMKDLILNNDGFIIKCPICGAALNTKVEEMFDLEDNLVLHPKARCSKCAFQIK